VIVEFRSEIKALFDSQDVLPLHHFVPDDVAELPCIVLGPPSLADGEPGTFDLTCEVYVCGRRIGDADSQHELDQYADQIITILGGVKGRHNLAVTAATPQLVPVAGSDIPTYRITVETTVRNC
jgi:hypothetical protein